MRAKLTDAIDGVWALRIIRGVVLPLTMALMGWVAVELVNMRDGVRDLQSTARELRAQVMDIRDEAKVAMKEAEVYRRQSASSDAETKTRLDSLEKTVKTLGDRVFSIFQKSQLDGPGFTTDRDHL